MLFMRLLSPGTRNSPSSLRASGWWRYSTHMETRTGLMPEGGGEGGSRVGSEGGGRREEGGGEERDGRKEGDR